MNYQEHVKHIFLHKLGLIFCILAFWYQNKLVGVLREPNIRPNEVSSSLYRTMDTKQSLKFSGQMDKRFWRNLCRRIQKQRSKIRVKSYHVKKL